MGMTDDCSENNDGKRYRQDDFDMDTNVPTLILKCVLTLAVIVLFGAIGLLAAEVRPFHAPEDMQRLRETLMDGANSTSVSEADVPEPPYTERVLTNRTKKGEYYGYESRLSVRGLAEFYTTELPRNGWERNEVMDSMKNVLHDGVRLLSFRKGAKRCMIYFKPQSGFKNNVTVLLMNAGELDPGTR